MHAEALRPSLSICVTSRRIGRTALILLLDKPNCRWSVFIIPQECRCAIGRETKAFATWIRWIRLRPVRPLWRSILRITKNRDARNGNR